MGEESPKPAAAEKNIGMGVLCYLGVLVFVPFLTDAKNDPFVKYHIKQGLVLFITGVIIGVATQLPVIGWFLVGPIGGILIFILMIMGIINVVNGKEQPLPAIGQYADKINI